MGKDETADLRDRLERVAAALQSEAMVTVDPLRRVALFSASANIRLRSLYMLQKYSAEEIQRAVARANDDGQTMFEQGGPQ